MNFTKDITVNMSPPLYEEEKFESKCPETLINGEDTSVNCGINLPLAYHAFPGNLPQLAFFLHQFFFCFSLFLDNHYSLFGTEIFKKIKVFKHELLL